MQIHDARRGDRHHDDHRDNRPEVVLIDETTNSQEYRIYCTDN